MINNKGFASIELSYILQAVPLMEFINWCLSLKQRGHEFSDIFSEPIVWLGLGLIPQSHSHSKPNLPVQAILIHSRQTMGLWANTPHAHLGKWPPAAVGFMTVIANEFDLTYSSINQLIKQWQKKLGNYIEESWRKFPWFILDLFFSSNRGLELKRCR